MLRAASGNTNDSRIRRLRRCQADDRRRHTQACNKRKKTNPQTVRLTTPPAAARAGERGSLRSGGRRATEPLPRALTVLGRPFPVRPRRRKRRLVRGPHQLPHAADEHYHGQRKKGGRAAEARKTGKAEQKRTQDEPEHGQREAADYERDPGPYRRLRRLPGAAGAAHAVVGEGDEPVRLHPPEGGGAALRAVARRAAV